MFNNGKLPHAFVNHTNLFAALQHLQFSLLVHHSHLTLIVPATSNLNYYYTKAKINTFCHDNKLIIRLHVPLTVDRLLTPLTVYRVDKILLLTSETDGQYSILALNFEAIAFSTDSEYYLIIDKLYHIQGADIVDLRTSPLQLHKNTLTRVPPHLSMANSTTL